jgi:hypothetical protein
VYLLSMSMFKSSAEIRKCAEELIAYLRDLQDARGTDWTNENFRRLEAFAKSKNPNLESYYRKQGEKSEFLWDFIASSTEAGIFLAAESEQEVHTPRHIVSLKHDFEKLLYVYSPIRILITKAKDQHHAQELADDLVAYARGCCLTFNPGASFILHFCLYDGAGNVSYHWQSAGEPNALSSEKIAFERINEPSR